jgi:orotate phosphoribosyltransferase
MLRIVEEEQKMLRSSEEWKEVFRQKGAIWRHDGYPLRPHAKLTASNGQERHSDGYCNCRIILEDRPLFEEACKDLIRHFVARGYELTGVDRVAGPATGADELSQELARCIGSARGYPCMSGSIEKGDTDHILAKQTIHPGELVLLTDNVLTTGESIERAAAGVYAAHSAVLTPVVVLVNRSRLSVVKGKTVVSLIRYPMSVWTPEECSLCRIGSIAIHPKEGDNWARLNATY